MSGHSKWATIKRKKGATDAARGKIFTKIVKELTTAARIGGADAEGNARLRKAIADAKAAQMPSDSIKRAIQRGTGELEGVNYDEVLYEGTGPAGTLFLVESMTDNRNRTVAEIRKIFERHAGALGSSGTGQWAFDRLGTVTLEKAKVTEDQLMEIALSAGADDYKDEGEIWLVTSPIDQLSNVVSAFEGAKITMQDSRIAFLPKNKKSVSGRDAEVCLNLLEALDDHDDVQNVFADFDISDDELKRIESA